MAAIAAKYAHCEVRYPVEYRTKVPFRPEILAPLDFGVRITEILQHDRELDRAVIGIPQYADLLRESADWGLGRGELFADSEDDRAVVSARAAHVPATPFAEGDRRAFMRNVLNLFAEGARFRPPWHPTMVQEAHAFLMRGLETRDPPGEFRHRSFTVTGRLGSPIFRACPPDRIGPELAAVLDWVDRAGPTMMPVIPAAVLLHAFQALRPFSSGNLAVGWILSQYYLQMFGLANVSRVPFVARASDPPEMRLRLLLWTEAAGSFAETVDFTLDATLDAYRGAVDRWLSAGTEDSPQLGETALRLLSVARRHPGWFSASEARRWVGRQSEQTVLRRLNELVRDGLMESLGRTRGKRFRVTDRRGLLPQLERHFDEEVGRPTRSARTGARHAERPRTAAADR